MKHINPLHLVVLFIVVFLFMLLKLGEAKTEFLQTQDTYNETVELIAKLDSLKEIYTDKDGVKKSLGIVLNQPTLKAANIKQILGSSGITLSASKMDQIALNSLMSKIYNGSYKVHLLEIKKINDAEVSLTMEIRW